MSAVIDAPIPASAPARRSAGVWTAAARRFRSDRVGVFSLVVVALFILLVVAAAVGLVAGDWQAERGVPDAPPTFVGPAPPAESIADFVESSRCSAWVPLRSRSRTEARVSSGARTRSP